MNPPTTVFNPYTNCTPTYNSNGQINCPSSSGCQSGSVQYTLCPYNPYLSDGKKCVSTTCDKPACKPCETPCCPDGYSCNSHNVNCVDGCYTTDVEVDWIAPLIFFSNLTSGTVGNIDMKITFQPENKDPDVIAGTCINPECSSSTDQVSRQCCPTQYCPTQCGTGCCYPDKPVAITFNAPGPNTTSGKLIPKDSLPIKTSFITPINSCCPNPCSDQIQVKLLVELNATIIGFGDSDTNNVNLTTTGSNVTIPLKVGSFFVDNTTANLILDYTYTCVCNEPTWTIYAGQLNFDSVT